MLTLFLEVLLQDDHPLERCLGVMETIIQRRSGTFSKQVFGEGCERALCQNNLQHVLDHVDSSQPIVGKLLQRNIRSGIAQVLYISSLLLAGSGVPFSASPT